MAVAELQRGTPEAYSPARLERDRTFFERLVPWKPPQQEALHQETSPQAGTETVVYEKGQSRTRKVVGETMVWGGGIYGIYQLVTLDIPGALVGGAVHIAGRWVRPKEGQ